jgi:predicted ATPase
MLDSLMIKNFRSLADLKVEKLGRVNLIVGKNNSGKSSVLEALRIHAGNAQPDVLVSISEEHDERYRVSENEASEPDAALPFQDFFMDRSFPTDDDTAIQIGSANNHDEVLSIQHVFVVEEQEQEPAEDSLGEMRFRVRRRTVSKQQLQNETGDVRQALQITKGQKRYPLLFLDSGSQPYQNLRSILIEKLNLIPCSVVPTRFISSDELADEWDKIALTDYAAIVKDAMRIITPEFENLIFVRNEEGRSGSRRDFQRRAIVKLSNVSRPVPLNSLGDGMLRVLQLVLKLFSAKGGFMLIDEFENGLHYSVQQKVWTLLFEMAEKLDIQVFATTHSWDCIVSFTKVALNKDCDGVLFRMGRSARTHDNGKIIATVFDEAALDDFTQADMEIR